MITSKLVEQGALLRLNKEEVPIIQKLLSNKGMSWDSLDASQMVMKLPQQYIGYIGLPSRRIIIKPKHSGVTISHILRIYYFLYSAEYTDLDTPMYDVEGGNDVNLSAMFIKELLEIVHCGLPVSYTLREDSLNYVRGNMLVTQTKMNILMHKSDSFVCEFDDLTRDIPINRVLLAAAKKLETHTKSPELAYTIRQFGNVDYKKYPAEVSTNKNTAYCKKAISLAYMILNDLTISTVGEKAAGESLLINFDRVYEDFIKKVLMVYSSLGKFSYWTAGKSYAYCSNDDGHIERDYLPDLLFDYYEEYGKPHARAILDMKNKTSSPFHNPDVYQMSFYSQMLSCKKVILCYPAGYDKPSCALRFVDENFHLQKIYAAYMNIAGNTAAEFKNNINSFVLKIECLL